MNKKSFKQKIAVIMAIVLTFGVFLPPETAQAMASDTKNSAPGMSSTQYMQNGISIESTNNFGNIIGKELTEKTAEQTENEGNNIFSVEMDGQTANVSFETTEDATLVVCIYSEDREEMVVSAASDVEVGQTEAKVCIEENLPKYFYLRSFLVNNETLRPLCTSYETPNYTREMQEFLAKTIDDFEQEKVLNLDEDKTNNFAVYSDETKIIKQTENENQVVEADYQNDKYVINNANEDITSLKEGDTFSYQYDNGEILIVKVASIKLDGSTVSITGEDTSMEEVFDYVKINSDIGISDAVVDMSEAAEGVEYKGLIEYKEDDIVQRQLKKGTDIDGSTSNALSYQFANVKLGSDNVKFSGNLEAGYKFSVKLYLSFSYNYLEVKADYSIKINGSLSAKVPFFKLPLGYIGFNPFPGVQIGLMPCFVIESNGKIDINGTLKGTVGIAVSNDENMKSLSSAPKFKTEVKGEITAFIGIDLSPELSILHEKAASVKLGATIGAEIKATFNPFHKASSSKVHACEKCIDGEITGKADAKYEVSLLNSEKLKHKRSENISVKICDFYYSFDFNEFDFTSCPHYKFKIDITVIDDEKNPVAGAQIKAPFSVNRNNQNQTVENAGDFVETNYITTDVTGKTIGYLPEGAYLLYVSAKDYIATSKGITVTDEAKNIRIILKKISPLPSPSVKPTEQPSSAPSEESTNSPIEQPTFNPSENPDSTLTNDIVSVSLGDLHSGAITKDGSLYMWGDNRYGQLGDGTKNTKTKPVKVLDNVASVSLGAYHSGAITKDGSLYMWGNNVFGKLGDGTTENKSEPVKVLNNVASVSLGAYHSGAITKDGSLYMWGNNVFGKLGDGTTENKSEPVKVLDNVVSVSLGISHSGAITKDGSLYIWGENGYGQLGDGTKNTKIKPVKVLDNVASVSLGDSYSGATTKDGNLYMWGYNSFSQLGDGTTMDKTKPVKVLDNVVSVSLGAYHSGAITKDGSLYMWGDNRYGQLGDGTTMDKTKPVKVLDNVVSVSLGAYHSGAITKDGSLYMWGNNVFGKLGDGTTVGKSEPVKVFDNIISAISYSNLSLTDNSQPIQLKNSAIDNMYIADRTLKSAAIQSKTFTGFLPNELYNFYILKSRSVENLLSPDNLLYLKQYISDSAGNINVTYQLNEIFGYDEPFVVGMSRLNLSDAQIEISDLIYNGSEQCIYPKVSYKGNELSEGEDYIISGDFNVTEEGDYSVTISGTGLYTGEITKSFKVKGTNTNIPEISPSPSIKPSDTGTGGNIGSGGGGALITPTPAPVATLTPTPKPFASIKPGTDSDSIFNNSSKKEITPADVTLNKKTIIYSGKEKKPGVTVLSGSLELIKDKEYTVSYSYNINVGTAYVTVYGKGDYYGSVTKSFKIIPKGIPVKGKAEPKHKGFAIKWKKQPVSITGYQVQYSTDKKFKGRTTVIRTVKKKSVTKLTVSKLKAKKKYYVRVRTYKIVKGRKYYSRWSKSKVVKTKK